MNHKLSVLVITYNHESFVETSIRSIANQHTNFPFVIEVFDDKSQDSTRRILNKLKSEFGELIRLHYRKKNLGVAKNFFGGMSRCKSEYIALCEGDDYWTDPNKVQKQINFLDAHPDYSICSHNVIVKDENTGKQLEWLGRNHEKTSVIEDILSKGSGGATCSLVLRRSVIEQIPDWFSQLPSGDWPLQILATSMGKMRYFPKPMAVYRRHSQGSTAVTSSKDLIRIFDTGGVKIIEQFDKHYKYKYHKEVEEALASYFYPNLLKAYQHLQNKNKVRKLSKLIINSSHFLKLSVKDKIKYYLFSII